MMVTIKIFVHEVLYRKELTQSNNLHVIWRSNFFMSAWSPFKIPKFLAPWEQTDKQTSKQICLKVAKVEVLP